MRLKEEITKYLDKLIRIGCDCEVCISKRNLLKWVLETNKAEVHLSQIARTGKAQPVPKTCPKCGSKLKYPEDGCNWCDWQPRQPVKAKPVPKTCANCRFINTPEDNKTEPCFSCDGIITHYSNWQPRQPLAKAKPNLLGLLEFNKKIAKDQEILKALIKTKLVPNYELGFEILIDYWDSLPVEELEEINKRLAKANL